MQKVLGGTVALTVIGLTVALIRLGPEQRPAPILSFVSVEPASGIVDKTGTDMWLAMLSISNSDNRPPFPKNYLYVKELKAKTANGWIGVDGTSPYGLAPGQKCVGLLLISAHTNSCQVRLKYAGSSLSFKGRPVKAPLLWLTERLPLSVRSRLSYRVWRWLGFNIYKPKSSWQEMEVALSLSTASPVPRDIPRLQYKYNASVIRE